MWIVQRIELSKFRQVISVGFEVLDRYVMQGNGGKQLQLQCKIELFKSTQVIGVAF